MINWIHAAKLVYYRVERDEIMINWINAVVCFWLERDDGFRSNSKERVWREEGSVERKMDTGERENREREEEDTGKRENF